MGLCYFVSQDNESKSPQFHGLSYVCFFFSKGISGSNRILLREYLLADFMDKGGVLNLGLSMEQSLYPWADPLDFLFLFFWLRFSFFLP